MPEALAEVPHPPGPERKSPPPTGTPVPDAPTPADGLRGPRQDRKLPHFVQRDDMLRLLGTPPSDQPLGVRDRAILETLYSAGLRVSELTGLNVDDVDLDDGCATVRGKGKRERL